MFTRIVYFTPFVTIEEKYRVRKTSGQRTLSLELVQKLAYASSEAEYDELYSQLQKDAPKEVVKYFDVYWHPIKKSGCWS